jgi:hypothetical protein
MPLPSKKKHPRLTKKKHPTKKETPKNLGSTL